jgi:hypothetical protein
VFTVVTSRGPSQASERGDGETGALIRGRGRHREPMRFRMIDDSMIDRPIAQLGALAR